MSVWSFGLKWNSGGVPQRRTSTLSSADLPSGCGRVREVRQVEQEVAQRPLHGVELAFEPLDLVADAGHFGEKLRRILAFRLRDADLLRRRVALRLQRLRANLDVLALRFERVEARGVERDAALGETRGDRGQIVPEKIDVEHC